MENKVKNTIKEVLIVLSAIASMVIGVLCLAMEWGLEWWICWIAFAVFIILGNAMVAFYYKKWMKTFKVCLICFICALIVAIVYCVCYYNDWLKYFESYQAIKDLILSAGIWGLLVFFFIQFAQVIVAPIPAMATILAGVAIYGPFLAAVISTIAILIGSYVAFFIGRFFGRKIVVWIAGEAQTKKYCDILNEKGKYLLILMFIFPVFPDDMLCMIAGITSMTFRYFFFATLVARPLGIFVTAYVGSGHLIPYSGWGLYVWPVLILLLVAAFIISWKYQDQIEKFFVEKFVGWQTSFRNKKARKCNKKLLKSALNERGKFKNKRRYIKFVKGEVVEMVKKKSLKARKPATPKGKVELEKQQVT